MNIATGFDMEPLPDGSVIIEFFGGDGKTLTKQAITAEVVTKISVVTVFIGIAIREGPEVVKEIITELNKKG